MVVLEQACEGVDSDALHGLSLMRWQGQGVTLITGGISEKGPIQRVFSCRCA